jgi:hypothetical protein
MLLFEWPAALRREGGMLLIARVPTVTANNLRRKAETVPI